MYGCDGANPVSCAQRVAHPHWRRDADHARSELDEARLQLRVLLDTVEALQSASEDVKDDAAVELATQLCAARAREAALERRAGDQLGALLAELDAALEEAEARGRAAAAAAAALHAAERGAEDGRAQGRAAAAQVGQLLGARRMYMHAWRVLCLQWGASFVCVSPGSSCHSVTIL